MHGISQNTCNFIKNEMCIDLDDLLCQIRNLNPDDVRNINLLIERFHSSLSAEDPEAYILEEFEKFPNFSNEDSIGYRLADPLRHAFTIFASGGLHQLFTGQENEDWYPKVVLIKVLEPNDILSLPQTVEIYRGCDISELNSGNFGQSWTTSKKVARQFAFDHYANRPWFQTGSRVILRAKIDKSSIFYSNQCGEFEISVNVRQLSEVAKDA